MAKLPAKKPLKSRVLSVEGGPWHGKDITTRLPINSSTLNIRVGANRGRYTMGEKMALWVKA